MHKPVDPKKGPHRQGHNHAPTELHPDVIKAGHEIGDIPLKPVFNFLIGLTLLSVVSFAIVYGVFLFFAAYKARTSAKPTPMAARQAGQLPPQPRLQVDALKEWVVFKAEQDSLVATYGWVDKGRGLVRLPQDRALEIMAGKAWPHRPGHYAPTGLSTMAPLSTVAPGAGEPAGHAVPGGAAPQENLHGETPQGGTPHAATPHAQTPAEGH